MRERWLPGIEAQEVEGEHRDRLAEGVRRGQHAFVMDARHVEPTSQPALDDGMVGALEVDMDLADVAAGTVPVRVRGQQSVAVRELREDERAVGHEVLGLAPVVSELLAHVAGPGERPRGEQVREVATRLADAHLERPVVQCRRARDVAEQERRTPLLLLQHPPGVHEVLGDQRGAVAPVGALPQPEQVGEPVAGNPEVVGHVGDDREPAVDGEQAAEEVLGELQPLGRVDVTGDDLVEGAPSRCAASPSPPAAAAPRRGSRRPRRTRPRRRRSRRRGGAPARS